MRPAGPMRRLRRSSESSRDFVEWRADYARLVAGVGLEPPAAETWRRDELSRVTCHSAPISNPFGKRLVSWLVIRLVS